MKNVLNLQSFQTSLNDSFVFNENPLISMQIGVFDPYSDDPRLAVKKLCLCPITGLLTVAGTAGQVVVAEFSDIQAEKEVPVGMIFSF